MSSSILLWQHQVNKHKENMRTSQCVIIILHSLQYYNIQSCIYVASIKLFSKVHHNILYEPTLYIIVYRFCDVVSQYL